MRLEPRPSSHLYPIADQSSEWICGTDGRGLQVFAYVWIEDIIAIYFAGDGALAEVRKTKLPAYDPSTGPGFAEAKERSESAALEAWRREIGFASGTIRIKRQAVEDLIIEDWPGCFFEFGADPAGVEPSEGHRKRLERQIERWQREGCYVLWFGKDYWMEGDGTIGST